ncbi:hypothetical protein Adi01nite_03580 [Amorphoplanes digitatis]|nr:hypothetical protein Adi01nite_03580 [Actinoplanes digitatis]
MVGGHTAEGPVTRVQEGMLSAEPVLAGRHSPFHVLVSAEITGALDVDRLRAVLDRATRRHASLRTICTRDPGTGRAGYRVLAAWDPVVAEQDLPPQPAGADAVELVHRLLAPAAPRLLRPYERPPVVFVLTRVAPGRSVLSVLAHHVILDGWSAGLLWREIAAGYRDRSPADPGGEPEPGMESLATAGPDLAGRRAAMLAGWPTVVEIPSDLVRPEVRDYAGARLPFTLTGDAAAGCAALARSLGVSRNVVLLAAWALTVARRAAVTRLLVGVPTAARTTATEMRVIGGPTGLAPVACEVPPGGTVADYVRGTGRATRESSGFDGAAFEDIVAALGAGRGDRSRNPLVQVAFGAHDELLPGVLTAGGTRFDVRLGHTGGTAYDAMLHVLAWRPAPTLELEYATSVLSPAEAMELAAGFDRALAEMAAAPGGPLAAVRTIGAAQRRRLDAWEPGPDADATRGLWQLIEEVAARDPDATAVRDADPARTLTYRELMAAAAAQSAVLVAAGAGVGDRVGLAVGRCAEEIVAVLGILRIGAAYVGIDPDTPTAIVTAMLDAAGARVVLGEPDRLAGLGAAADGRRTIPVVDPHATAGAVPPVPAAGDPDRVAYIAFTSGTTGLPKGAMIPCRAVVRLLHEPGFLSPGAAARFARLAPLAFDASTLEIFAPLFAGGTVEVLAGSPTPNGLAAFLRDRAITGLFLTTGLLRLAADYRPDGFRGVVQLVTGGEALPPGAVAEILRACPGLRVTNAYGPTENTTFTTVHHLDDPVSVAAHAVPIGRPIAGTGVLVLDPDGRDLPPGAVGELFAYGDGLALGYAGRAAETAAAFGEFGRGDGRRLYRTGDLVRWDSGGNLVFLGRCDRQVKIRGFRVEPDQVAAVLRRHPDVRDAAVAVVPLADGDKQLLAALVPAGRAPRPDEVRDFAARHLPGHALPWRWAVVDELPVNPNGKVDYARLLEIAGPPGSPPRGDEGGPPSADSLEEIIATAWRDVLGHRDFGRDDWFFEVGGDSLALVRVHTILGETLAGHPVSIADLYICATISALAARLRAGAAHNEREVTAA